MTQVVVDGTSWSPAFLTSLQSAGEGNGSGYTIPVGSSAQIAALPWSNVNQIQVMFSKDVNVQKTSLVLSGLSIASYTFSDFSYSSASHTAVWTLASPIGTDKLSLDVHSNGPDFVTDKSGNPLDGEWTNSVSVYPSGNGSAGGDFNFAFNVLPGDPNGDGIVNSQDLALVSSGWLGAGPTGDVNADGIVNAQDLALLSSNWLATLTPGPPHSGASVAGADSAAQVVATLSMAEARRGDSASAIAVNSPTPTSAASHEIGTSLAAATRPGEQSSLKNTDLTLRPPSFVGPLQPEHASAFIGRIEQDQPNQ